MQRCKCDGQAMSVFKRAGGQLKKFGGTIFDFCRANPSECSMAGKAVVG